MIKILFALLIVNFIHLLVPTASRGQTSPVNIKDFRIGYGVRVSLSLSESHIVKIDTTELRSISVNEIESVDFVRENVQQALGTEYRNEDALMVIRLTPDGELNFISRRKIQQRKTSSAVTKPGGDFNYDNGAL